MTLRSQRNSGMRARLLVDGGGSSNTKTSSYFPLVRVPRLVDRVRGEALELGIDELRLPGEPDEVFRHVAREQLLDPRVRSLSYALVVRAQRVALCRVHFWVLVARVVHAVGMPRSWNLVARKERVIVGSETGDPAGHGEIEFAGGQDPALTVGREEEIGGVGLDLCVDPRLFEHGLDLHRDQRSGSVLDVVR